MNLRHSRAWMIGMAVLSFLSACSPTAETSQLSKTADSSQTAQLPQSAAGPSSSHSSGDLDCPVAFAQQAGGTLEGTPSQIDSMGRQLGAGGENEIAAAVARLRSRHPKSSYGEIVNYLITAYCPTIKAKEYMSLGEKQQAVRSFATRARKLAVPA